MASPTDRAGAPTPPLLSLRGVTKVYGQGGAAVTALAGIDLDVTPGEFVAITGASGSGKSTAMSIFGCLEVPTEGEYRIEGFPVQDLSGDVLAALRNSRFGFVFQQFNLLTRTSALENVSMPLVYAAVGARERARRSREALATVGLAGREGARTNELSGGEQQRVAIARAIVNEPAIVLADEPTGNLDSANGDAVMEMLSGVTLQGTTIIMVTHSETHAKRADRVVYMLDGRFADTAEI